jgi:hypothetical protein
MSRRWMGLVAVGAASALLIGVALVRSAVVPAPAGSGGLFGAFVQPGPTTGPDRAVRAMASDPYFNPSPTIVTSPAPG